MSDYLDDHVLGAPPLGVRFGRQVADAFASKLMDRLEEDGALPLPTRAYDVVVDDPDMSQAYVYRRIIAISPRAAQVAAYSRAAREEGFRVCAVHPEGDEVTVSCGGAREGALMWAIVHRQGRHPRIDYRDNTVKAKEPVAGSPTGR